MMAFQLDENMLEKSLDECVRRWVPAMSGYADAFNETHDKNAMLSVPHDKMLGYGGGDGDATFRLAKVTVPLAKRDEGNWNCYRRVQHPTLLAFGNVVEPNGIPIDTDILADLQIKLNKAEKREHKTLMRMVPRKVKQKHAEAGLKFSRPDFVRDILFSKEGFKLKPRVFTKTTRKLSEEQRIPSTSAKDHLPYFQTNPFVSRYMDYTRLTKLQSTYVGIEAENTGFWKYIHEGYIHPSFLLHRVVTGRTSSASLFGNCSEYLLQESRKLKNIFIYTVDI